MDLRSELNRKSEPGTRKSEPETRKSEPETRVADETYSRRLIEFFDKT